MQAALVRAVTTVGLLAITLALGTPVNAGVSVFAGTWYGHTRSLRITPMGRAVESIGSGCCHPVIDLRFRLTYRSRLTATMTVTWVRVPNRSLLGRRRAPRVGEHGTLRLTNGVIHEPLTGTTYCRPGVDKCGA